MRAQGTQKYSAIAKTTTDYREELPYNFFAGSYCIYLSKGKQLVWVANVQSGLVDILNGVSQGYVPGPVLFIMYIIDLPKSSAFYTALYPDVTYFRRSNKNPDYLQHVVNMEPN